MKKKYYFFVLLGLFGVCITITYAIVKKHSISAGSIEKLLYSLTPSITEEELERDGFINISGVLPKENKVISRFLSKVETNKKSILKLFYWYEKDLYIKILFYDPDYKEVRSWTYLPIKQYAVSPDKRFSKNYEITENDNIITIKLINIKNNSIPAEQFLADEILYSYYMN